MERATWLMELLNTSKTAFLVQGTGTCAKCKRPYANTDLQFVSIDSALYKGNLCSLKLQNPRDPELIKKTMASTSLFKNEFQATLRSGSKHDCVTSAEVYLHWAIFHPIRSHDFPVPLGPDVKRTGNRVAAWGSYSWTVRLIHLSENPASALTSRLSQHPVQRLTHTLPDRNRERRFIGPSRPGWVLISCNWAPKYSRGPAAEHLTSWLRCKACFIEAHGGGAPPAVTP